jgi:uncharacterized membrane protein
MEAVMNDIKHTGFDTADITALSHLYRGEVYRSTVWRTRLDTTTNWAVVTTGLALSMTFSSETASPLPLVLVGLLVAVFLLIEARRYRFFDFFSDPGAYNGSVFLRTDPPRAGCPGR